MTVQLSNLGPRVGGWWRRSRQPLFAVAPGWRRLVRVVAGLLLLYLLLTLVALPPLLRWWWPKLAEQLWQQPASLGDVRFHPFDLALTLDELTLGTADGHGVPPIAVAHAHLNLALWRSVVQRGWVISELTVNGVTLAAERQADGQIDLAWLWRSSDAEAEPQRVASAAPPRLLVEQLQLMATQLSWRDQAVTPAVAVSSDALTVSGSNLGTIDGNPGELVLQLTLADGGALGVNTRVRLQPVAAEGRIAVAALPLSSGWGYWAGLVNLEPPAGLLALDSRFHYHQGQEAQGEQPAVAASAALEQASVVLSDLGLRLRGGESLLQLQQLQLDGGAVRWPQQQLALEQLTIADGKAVVAWSPQGTLNWQQLLAAAAPESDRQPPQPVADPAVVTPATPWQFTLGALRLNRLALDLTDERMAQPLAISVAAIDLQASGKATLADAPALQLAIKSLGINNSHIGQVNQPPLVTVGQVGVSDATLDLARQQMALAGLTISDWQLAIERNAAGQINLLPLFTPRQPAAAASEPSTLPWQLRLDQLQLAGGTLSVRDDHLSTGLAYEWRKIQLDLTPLVWPLAGSSTVKLRSGRASAGEWQFDGQLDLVALTLDGRYRIEGMDLLPLQPLLSDATVLKLQRGKLYSNGPLQVGGDQVFHVGGTVSLGKVQMVDESNDEAVVGWDQLRADGLSIGGSPFKVAAELVKLRKPNAKVVIFSDRTTNLGRLRRQPLADAAATTAKATGRGEPQEPEQPLVRVERVEVSDGKVDFADLSLLLPFATYITDFNGVISGISSASKARATLQLEGEVTPYGEARVSGSLAPAAPRQFSDINVQFRNLALSPLSPYTATFAGRHIAAGRLNLDLQYRVENSRLNSDNAVVLQGLTLGETVESPDAVSLPLDLAIALLSDSDGKIDIALPVSGDVDSPEFSYGQVIGKAVVNLLTGIVTSPFRALGKLLGEEGALPEQVSYLPGQATLRGAEREKVLNLADVLAQRPQLGLEVVGGFDPDVDRLTLQQSALRVALAEALDSSVGSSELFAPLPLAEAEYQYQLQRLADQRLGKLVVAEVIAEFVTANDREPEQVSALAASIGNASADIAYYQQLANRLIPTMAVGEPQLQALATLRAEAVVTAMTSAGVPPAQLRVAATNQQVKASGGQQALDTLVAVNLKLFSLK